MSNYASDCSDGEYEDVEYSCQDSFKFFNALMKFNKDEMSHAEEILHTIACSTDYIDWDATSMEVIINKIVLKESNIVDLVKYLLNTENEVEPVGLETFVEALKQIGMESKWVLNKTIASELNEYDSSESSGSSSDEEPDIN